MIKQFSVFISLLFLIAAQMAFAQNDQVNYDESQVPEYQLPQLFQASGGQDAETVRAWEHLRRPEIVHLFGEYVYGHIPAHFEAISFQVVNEEDAVNGTAKLREVDVSVTRNDESVMIRLNLFIPNNVPKPVPVFLLINHRDSENIDPTRNVRTDFWPVEEVIARGYAVAAFQVHDVSDDDADTYAEDILEKLYPELIGQPNGMRALSAWAWGAMRMMDYFSRDPDIDEDKSVLVGHSRGGKAALWAGANDERFGIIVSNESGAGGAALARRRFGETVQIINNGFPHWFTPNYETYNENEEALPIDQHMLIATVAPRPVYVASARDDEWADPRGEFLSLKLGSEVHSKLYGLPVDLPSDLPGNHNPVVESYAGHHIREGGHGLTLYDWQRFMDFADYHFIRADN